MSESPDSPAPAAGRIPVARLNGMINLTSLGLMIWGLSYEAHTSVTGPASHVAGLVLMVVATAGWLGWFYARFRPDKQGYHATALVVMALAGGALAAFAPLATVYAGVAALGCTSSWPLPRVILIIGGGPAATLISGLASGHRLTPTLVCIAATLAGTVMGISRRDAQERAARAAAVELAQGRAELLAARNHLGRELHDVLAHTLSAASLQLEALDTLLHAGPPPSPQVADQLQRTKRLVHDGLDEARGAVRALREDLPSLDERLAGLVADRDAGLSVSGRPRDLPADVALTLYRVAQEAITNAMKHAPGTVPEVRLDYSDKTVSLSVTNPAPQSGRSALAGSGGGYGLQGIRERVLLLGGRVEAGAGDGGGWRVHAEVPA